MAAEAKKSPEQLLLDWPVREIFSEEEFLPSHSNEAAVRWVDGWPNWQRGGEAFHCLIINGPDGCGKTHLAHVWKKLADARIVKVEDLRGLSFIKNEQKAYIIEDIDDKIIDKNTAELILHLYNWLKEHGGYLLLTAKSEPNKWKINLADLSSRLLASETVKITPPDDALLQAVIIKQFSDRQIILSAKVVGYIIKHADRSFSFIRRLVEQIDNTSMSEKKKITIPMVKRVLKSLGDN